MRVVSDPTCASAQWSHFQNISGTRAVVRDAAAMGSPTELERARGSLPRASGLGTTSSRRFSGRADSGLHRAVGSQGERTRDYRAVGSQRSQRPKFHAGCYSARLFDALRVSGPSVVRGEAFLEGWQLDRWARTVTCQFQIISGHASYQPVSTVTLVASAPSCSISLGVGATRTGRRSTLQPGTNG